MEEAARIAIDSARVLAPALRWVRRIRFVLHDDVAFETHARVMDALLQNKKEA